MGNNRKRYHELEHYMSLALIALGIILLVFLISAGLGITWLKVITAILTILGSGLGIAYLYMTGELLKFRSRWMAVGFAAILLVTLASLLLRYPSPNAYKNMSQPKAAVVFQETNI